MDHRLQGGLHTRPGKGSWRRTDLNVAGEKKDDVPLAPIASAVALVSSIVLLVTGR
jgi:hypothetical protein